MACHRLLDNINKYNLENPRLPLYISKGIATTDKTTTKLHSVFEEADNNMYREKLLHRQSNRNAITQALTKALEERDFITEGHVERLQELVTRMAQVLNMPEGRMTDLRLLARFHDIGKVGIPNQILFKPGKLTSDEITEMQRHCEIGHRIAQSSPDLTPVSDWILRHHEAWNGTGYPLGLKGEEIPLECRIVAIADAYDAMTNNRPYRKALPQEDAIAELIRNSGTQFDPVLVPIFISIIKSEQP
jgi:HD-GYP domain-containing protein (c-di-GMP phosphodiesterase class II)